MCTKRALFWLPLERIRPIQGRQRKPAFRTWAGFRRCRCSRGSRKTGRRRRWQRGGSMEGGVARSAHSSKYSPKRFAPSSRRLRPTRREAALPLFANLGQQRRLLAPLSLLARLRTRPRRRDSQLLHRTLECPPISSTNRRHRQSCPTCHRYLDERRGTHLRPGNTRAHRVPAAAQLRALGASSEGVAGKDQTARLGCC
jgi:hypothetical protein